MPSFWVPFQATIGLKKEERTDIESTKSSLECTWREHSAKPCCQKERGFGFSLYGPPCVAPPAALGASSSSEHAISIAICILANSTPSDSLIIPFALSFHISLSLSLALARLLLEVR